MMIVHQEKPHWLVLYRDHSSLIDPLISRVQLIATGVKGQKKLCFEVGTRREVANPTLQRFDFEEGSLKAIICQLSALTAR